MARFELLDDMRSLESALKCKVCNKLLNDPLIIVKCGHTTCKICFSRHMDMTCPVCKIPVTTKDSMEDKQLRDILLQLELMKTNLAKEDTQSKVNVVASEIKAPLVNSVQKTLDFSPVTPKVTKGRLSSKLPLLHSEESTSEQTPIRKVAKTPSTNSGKKQLTKKRLSTSSVSSPNTSTHKSPLNRKNFKGETPLQRAVIKGDVEKVKELLKEGALVNTQDNNGWTPLHEASNRGNLEIATLLLDHGALVNVPSLKDNVTPLHDALLNKQMPMAKLLVTRGGDLHAKASFGYSALDLCESDEDRGILTEACSPFIDASTMMPDAKVTPTESPNMLVLLASNLSDAQKQQLRKCATLLKADIVEEFKSDVTHIVTSCDGTGNCTRTMKFLMGVLTGKWLMNYQWIEVCLEYKLKVEEEIFEVQGTKNQPNTLGPKQARQNYEQKFPSLFDGFFFYLHGSFSSPTPSREELCNLIHLGGGKILSREPREETVSAQPHLIPYHAAGQSLENTSHVILYQDKPPHNVHLEMGHIRTTQVMWLIACISEFKILPVQQTKVSP